MKVKQASELIKSSNSTIQRLMNAVGTMKINPQEMLISETTSLMNSPYQTKYQK
jgi:hypothetical protein